MTPAQIDALVQELREKEEESIERLVQLFAQRNEIRPRAQVDANNAQRALELQRHALRQAKQSGSPQSIEKNLRQLEAAWRANAAAAERLRQSLELSVQQIADIDAKSMAEEIRAYPHARTFSVKDGYLAVYLNTVIIKAGRYHFEIGDFWIRYFVVQNSLKVLCLRSTSDLPNHQHPYWYIYGFVCLGKSQEEITDYFRLGRPHPALDITWKILTDPTHDLDTLKHWRKIS